MRDAILKRISTRTFQKEQLSKSQINEIKAVLDKYNTVVGPFDHSYKFTFSLNENTENQKQKIGTYGLLKNVPAYIGGVSLDNRDAIIDFGYVFEMIILELTELGYDTCWLGGTFRRKDYRRKLEPNEIIPAISPVGHQAQKRTIIDRIIHGKKISRNRKPFGELFQYFDVMEELEEKADSRLTDVMHLVQMGPSASNKQPWRIYVTEDHETVHVYLKRDVAYGQALGYDMQALDIGIALAHLEIGLQHHGFKYEKKVYDKDVFFDGLEYIITYQKAN
jgi:nitroreductase